jgi:IS5 family transposase
MPGNPYDGHTLTEVLEQAAILSDVSHEVAIVDRGYKGVAIAEVKIYHPGLRRGITRGLRAMIRRRSAIEPAIGHMKTDGKLDRNWLKGTMATQFTRYCEVEIPELANVKHVFVKASARVDNRAKNRHQSAPERERRDAWLPQSFLSSFGQVTLRA